MCVVKTNMTISLDVDIVQACKKRPAGFASKACNKALREALDMPDTKEEIQRKKQSERNKVYVEGVGWVQCGGGRVY